MALQWRRRRLSLRSEGSGHPRRFGKILAELFKGEKEEFIRIKRQDGFSMYNPPSWVTPNPTTLLNLLPESILMNINPSICNRNGERSPRSSTAQPHSHRTTIGTLTPDLKRIRTYSWCSRMGCSTRRAMMAWKWPSPPTIPVFSLPHT